MLNCIKWMFVESVLIEAYAVDLVKFTPLYLDKFKLLKIAMGLEVRLSVSHGGKEQRLHKKF